MLGITIVLSPSNRHKFRLINPEPLTRKPKNRLSFPTPNESSNFDSMLYNAMWHPVTWYLLSSNLNKLNFNTGYEWRRSKSTLFINYDHLYLSRFFKAYILNNTKLRKKCIQQNFFCCPEQIFFCPNKTFCLSNKIWLI